ncbi:MAG: hypothetical protein OXL68_02380, partial [Paracoccaceae bacterium]|nr:hypothetical protein [Paracoccaceae bacterium]
PTGSRLKSGAIVRNRIGHPDERQREECPAHHRTREVFVRRGEFAVMVNPAPVDCERSWRILETARRIETGAEADA